MSTARLKAGITRERITHGLFALFGLAFLLLSAPAVVEPMTFWTGIVIGEYLYPNHELHHLMLGIVFPLLLLGVIAQAFRPRDRVGALHTAIVIVAAIIVIFSIGGEFSAIQLLLLALLVGMALTHPAGIEQLPDPASASKPFLVVASITALGGLALVAVELNAHFTAHDGHVAFDHYLFMAVAGTSIAVLGIYASLRPINWRFPAYSVVAMLLVFGGGSVLYPGAEQGSSLGVGLGAVVILWAILFALVAERGEEILDRNGR